MQSEIADRSASLIDAHSLYQLTAKSPIEPHAVRITSKPEVIETHSQFLVGRQSKKWKSVSPAAFLSGPSDHRANSRRVAAPAALRSLLGSTFIVQACVARAALDPALPLPLSGRGTHRGGAPPAAPAATAKAPRYAA